MAKPRENTSLRLPSALLERADALLPVLAGADEVAAHGEVKRATVLRLAIMRGLAELERTYATRAKGPR